MADKILPLESISSAVTAATTSVIFSHSVIRLCTICRAVENMSILLMAIDAAFSSAEMSLSWSVRNWANCSSVIACTVCQYSLAKAITPVSTPASSASLLDRPGILVAACMMSVSSELAKV